MLTVWEYVRRQVDMGKQMGKEEVNSEMDMISVIVSERLIGSLTQGQRKKPLFLLFRKGLPTPEDVNKIIRVMM